MTSPFDDYEVEKEMRASARDQSFDLDLALQSLVVLHARVAEDAFTAKTLGLERLGNGIVIGAAGLVLTIGYLITEAEEVTLLTNDGRRVPGHVLGVDPVTGLGLLQALEPLNLPALPLGTRAKCSPATPSSSLAAAVGPTPWRVRLDARAPFAGYWEYSLDDALFTEPGHPHWSGGAVIGPSGALMGVGSLQMVRQAPDGEATLINMSVPIELLPPILDDLSRGRPAQPPRPWLGIFSQDAGVGVVGDGRGRGWSGGSRRAAPGRCHPGRRGQIITDLADFYSELWKLGPAGVVVPLRVKRESDIFDLEIRSIDRASKLKKRRFN